MSDLREQIVKIFNNWKDDGKCYIDEDSFQAMSHEVIQLFQASLPELPLLSDEGLATLPVPTDAEINNELDNPDNYFGENIHPQILKITGYIIVSMKKAAQEQRDKDQRTLQEYLQRG